MPEVRPIDANALDFEKLQDTNGKAVPILEYIAFFKRGNGGGRTDKKCALA